MFLSRESLPLGLFVHSAKHDACASSWKPLTRARKSGSGDESRRWRLAERVDAVDHQAYSIPILQREYLAAVSAQPEMLDGMRLLDPASRGLLVESKQATLAIIERGPAIRICTR